MSGVTDAADKLAGILAPTPTQPSARWRWGTVVAVNDTGTMDVSVGGAVMPSVRCAAHVMGASVGDRVRVAYYGTDALVDAVRATGPSDMPEIQTGAWSIPSGSGISGTTYKDYAITFAREFGTAPQVVACLAGGSTAGEMGSITVGVLSVTATGFTARLWANGVASARNPTIRYIAVAQ